MIQPSQRDSRLASLIHVLIGDEEERRRVVHDAAHGQYFVEIAQWPVDLSQEKFFAPGTLWIVSSGPWGPVSEIAATLRRCARDAVILAIVAESQELLTAIAGGANDVVVRPFRTCELLARLRASISSEAVADFCDLQLDSQLSAVQLGGTEVRLRRAEFNVLQYIVIQRSRAVPAQEILEAVFGTSGDGGSIRNHIWEIRRKLRDAGLPMVISTVKGAGYQANLGAVDVKRFSSDRAHTVAGHSALTEI